MQGLRKRSEADQGRQNVDEEPNKPDTDGGAAQSYCGVPELYSPWDGRGGNRVYLPSTMTTMSSSSLYTV